jgi:hypothetical protein
MEAAGQGSSAPRAAAGRAGVCISHRMVAAAGGRWGRREDMRLGFKWLWLVAYLQESQTLLVSISSHLPEDI